MFARFCFHFGTGFMKKLLRMLWKTFVLFSLFPFNAKPGLTRPGDQNEAKTRPRWIQDAYLSSSSASLSKHLAKMIATWGPQKMSPRFSQRRAHKLLILGSMCAILATSWREVGQLSAILAPTWPILAPRCAPTGLRREPRARPNQHPGASWRQAARQEPPNLPGTFIF